MSVRAQQKRLCAVCNTGDDDTFEFFENTKVLPLDAELKFAVVISFTTLGEDREWGDNKNCSIFGFGTALCARLRHQLWSSKRAAQAQVVEQAAKP